MTPNLPQLEDELRYLGYRVPQIVLRTYTQDRQERLQSWCRQQLNLHPGQSGRRSTKPDWLERFVVRRKGTRLC